MSQEIEHKYLVKNQDYKEIAKNVISIKQGYLSRDPERTVRIRLWDNDGYITIKGKNQGDCRGFHSCDEFRDGKSGLHIASHRIQQNQYAINLPAVLNSRKLWQNMLILGCFR